MQTLRVQFLLRSETPTRQAAGHLQRSSKQLRRPLLYIPVMLDVFLNDLPSHTVANCASEVSVLPQLSGPQPLLQPRELAEQLPRTDALYYPDHLPDGPSGRKRYQDVYMILCYFYFSYLQSILLAYLPYHLFRSSPYFFFSEYIFPTFRTPYQMVYRIVDLMTRPLQSHASFYPIVSQGPIRIRETSRLPYNPPCKACIHPRGKPRGILQSFS